MIDLYYGSSYFDFLLRTPPQFIYPDRPKELSWIYLDYGMTTGGGFYELAEAYLNFGLIGVFIIPTIISFILSFSYKMFLMNKYSVYHSIVFFALIVSFMRGELYQSFVFYKGIVTAIVMIIILYILYTL